MNVTETSATDILNGIIQTLDRHVPSMLPTSRLGLVRSFCRSCHWMVCVLSWRAGTFTYFDWCHMGFEQTLPFNRGCFNYLFWRSFPHPNTKKNHEPYTPKKHHGSKKTYFAKQLFWPSTKKSENFGDFQLFLFGESMKLNPHPPPKKKNRNKNINTMRREVRTSTLFINILPMPPPPKYKGSWSLVIPDPLRRPYFFGGNVALGGGKTLGFPE